MSDLTFFQLEPFIRLPCLDIHALIQDGRQLAIVLNNLSWSYQIALARSPDLNIKDIIKDADQLSTCLMCIENDYKLMFMTDCELNMSIIISNPRDLGLILNHISSLTWKRFFDFFALDIYKIIKTGEDLHTLLTTLADEEKRRTILFYSRFDLNRIVKTGVELCLVLTQLSPLIRMDFLKHSGLKLKSLLNQGKDLGIILNLTPTHTWSDFLLDNDLDPAFLVNNHWAEMVQLF